MFFALNNSYGVSPTKVQFFRIVFSSCRRRNSGQISDLEKEENLSNSRAINETIRQKYAELGPMAYVKKSPCFFGKTRYTQQWIPRVTIKTIKTLYLTMNSPFYHVLFVDLARRLCWFCLSRWWRPGCSAVHSLFLAGKSSSPKATSRYNWRKQINDNCFSVQLGQNTWHF